jgi:hypothetical protein
VADPAHLFGQALRGEADDFVPQRPRIAVDTILAAFVIGLIGRYSARLAVRCSAGSFPV